MKWIISSFLTWSASSLESPELSIKYYNVDPMNISLSDRPCLSIKHPSSSPSAISLNSLTFGTRIFNSTSNPTPNLFLMCWELPKHLNWPPFTMMPILVLRASASSIKCDVRITALVFLAAILPTTSHMKRRASGSMPADGSSKRMMGGLPTMAIATDSFRLFPPDRVPACFLR